MSRSKPHFGTVMPGPSSISTRLHAVVALIGSTFGGSLLHSLSHSVLPCTSFRARLSAPTISH
jgi:hypothetical protein